MKRDPIPPGARFGRLTVLYETDEAVRRRALCRCDCGTEKMIRTGHLKAGLIQSCGCLQREVREGMAERRKTHGKCDTREYSVWSSMIDRCCNERSASYPEYGGRGISICARWRNSFEYFLADMGPRPPGTTIDRIDNDKGYEPGNCRWATRTQQNRNRSIVRQILFRWKTMSMPEWAEHLGITHSALRMRLRRSSADVALRSRVKSP